MIDLLQINLFFILFIKNKTLIIFKYIKTTTREDGKFLFFSKFYLKVIPKFFSKIKPNA